MSFNLSRLYRPVTGEPFRRSPAYRELAPSPALAPYICCYWGGTGDSSSSLVIPDTCMDVILTIDGPSKRVGAYFSGIQDQSFTAGQGKQASRAETFGIRFYGWAAALFADEDMSGALTGYGDSERYFPGLRKYLEDLLAYASCLEERAAVTEHYLAGRLESLREQPVPLLNSLYRMMKTTGRASVEDIAGYACVGQRQLERLFKQWTGLSPKKMSGLIRYQYLWQEMAFGNLQPQDAVMRYGFVDQAHLLNTFRRYHGLSPGQAVKLAWAGRRMSGFCNTGAAADDRMGEAPDVPFRLHFGEGR